MQKLFQKNAFVCIGRLYIDVLRLGDDDLYSSVEYNSNKSNHLVLDSDWIQSIECNICAVGIQSHFVEVTVYRSSWIL